MIIKEFNFGETGQARRTNKQRPLPGTWAIVCGPSGKQGEAKVRVATLAGVEWVDTTGERWSLGSFPYWRPVLTADGDALALIGAYEATHGAPERVAPTGYQEGETTNRRLNQ